MKSDPAESRMRLVQKHEVQKSANLRKQDVEVMACKKVSVNWSVGDDSWKKVSTEELCNVISDYKLHDNGLSVWSWRLDLRCPMPSGNLQFYDESGDCYDLGIPSPGDFYLRYNSDRPTIVRVGYGGSCSDCKKK